MSGFGSKVGSIGISSYRIKSDKRLSINILVP